MQRSSIAILFTASLITACGGGGGSSGAIPDQCNPLGGQGCLLPWPSALYLDTDATSSTGYRLDLPANAMPVNEDPSAVSPLPYNRWDGFSPAGPLLAAFSTGVSGSNLPPFDDIDQSLAADSPIVLINMDTGERAPFFAELDMNEPNVPDRDLIIRPVTRLAPSSHYAVAIRNTVTAPDGTPLPISPAFAALVAGTDFDHPQFDKLKASYDAIFAALATAGVDKSELVLAWDFRTASDAFLTSDLLTMRDAALPMLGSNGSNLTFNTMELANTAQTYKMYYGTFKSPTFLTDGEADDSILTRDASGKPAYVGMRDANYAAIIPKCASDGSFPLPRPTIVFGHGLFGDAKQYLTDDFTQTLAQTFCFVIVAGDWIGLTDRQLQLAPLAANDMNKAYQISEKLAQAVIDFIALETATRTTMAADPAFAINGQAVIDPQKTFYVGGSLGAIMGNTFMAYDPNITKGVLAVAGGNWSMLFERSNAWTLLEGAAQGSYDDPYVYQLNIALLGMAMEPYDPITTAAHVLADPLAGSVAKTILMWYSMGDCLVSNLTSEMMARTMNIPLLSPAVKTGWHMTPTAGPLQNGIEVFNDHPTPLPPDTNVPPQVDNGTHSGINKKPAALRMVEQFLLEGPVLQECLVDGAPAACDCATGACDGSDDIVIPD
jgi:hypothetical protein